MQKEMTAVEQANINEEELSDLLIAISVVAKRLATKMSENQKSKEKSDVQELRTDGTDRQS